MPRKAPKQVRSKALVDAVLESAARVLKKSDYSKSTTNKIAEIAGVSIGSIYQYFPGKDALIGALMDRQIRKNLDVIEKQILSSRELSLGRALDALCESAVDLFISEAPFFKKLFSIAPHLGRIESIIESRARAESLFCDLLLSHNPDGDAGANRARAFIAVHSFMGVIQYCALAGLPVGWDRARLASELKQLLRSYLL